MRDRGEKAGFVEGLPQELRFGLDSPRPRYEIVVRADNIEKARLVPDWAALGLGADKPKPGRGPRPAKDNKSDKKSNHKPAASKPSRAE